ncbi:bacillithiol biosynthesis deacetylase BshB1 [Heliobacillus mobilis]|uniref:Bacillithiol biosynthesis deacetylase BshB1 n=1 Tax=Heliobacterium mobile TaxID=28064 RepID=A0A6I3SGB2_HELMO|nr:bacillithiol biosynthesis deacetylase BshB1 [Heliobacterium mobile]MTV47541.1 bacillithiol biosynthesis deacetylase BshB1 [Heliobacterium mobile]
MKNLIDEDWREASHRQKELIFRNEAVFADRESLTEERDQPADILAFGAHPDDVELGVGGTLALAAAQGRSVVIIDLTRGEMASRGTVEERWKEACDAARILGVRERINGQWPDGHLSDPSRWQPWMEQFVHWLRRYRPKLVLAPGGSDRHPDHEAAGQLVRKALFYGGLKKFGDTPSEPWRPARFLTYRINGNLLQENKEPLYVDVGSVYEQKRAALCAYQSQFFRGLGGRRQELRIPDLPQLLEDRDRYLGGLIGTTFAEPLYPDGPLGVKEIGALWE